MKKIALILAALLQFQIHVDLLTVAQQAQGQFAAHRHSTHLSTQCGKAADWLTVQ